MTAVNRDLRAYRMPCDHKETMDSRPVQTVKAQAMSVKRLYTSSEVHRGYNLGRTEPEYQPWRVYPHCVLFLPYLLWWSDGYTCTGEIATAGVTVAVDPKVIPLGTNLVINGRTYTAQDTGSAIQGNRSTFTLTVIRQHLSSVYKYQKFLWRFLSDMTTVIITAIICATIVAIAIIGKSSNKNA